jgi:hypothetical protein
MGNKEVLALRVCAEEDKDGWACLWLHRLGNCIKTVACLQLASSSHHGFVTVAFKFACSLNDFSSRCIPGSNIRGHVLCTRKRICGHMVWMVAIIGAYSKG